MPSNTYVVEVLRTGVVTVTVTADSPEEAYQQVDALDFELPPFIEFVDGCEFVVYPANEQGEITGDELLREG